jgi:hypothetical protein
MRKAEIGMRKAEGGRWKAEGGRKKVNKKGRNTFSLNF